MLTEISACLAHLCIPSIGKSARRIVGTQRIFPEEVD